MPALITPSTGPVWIHVASEPQSIEFAIARVRWEATAEKIDGTTKIRAPWDNFYVGTPAEANRVTQRLEDFRSLLIASFYLADALSLTPPELGDFGLSKLPAVAMTKRSASDFSSAARALWVERALQTTWELLDARADRMGIPSGADERIATRGGLLPWLKIPIGGVPVLPPEAGAAWVLPAVGMVLGAVTVCFLVERSAQIIDRMLARQADSSAMMTTQARVLDLLNTHREQEKAAGKEIPLTSTELEVLKRLQGLQDDYGKRTAAGGPFPELFPSSGQVTGLGSGVILAVAAVVALVLLRKG